MRFFSFVCLALLVAGCDQTPPQTGSPFDDPQLLATVGEEKITKADLERAVADRPIAPDALLDEMIEHRALVQIARERGYDRDRQHMDAVERLLANRVREEQRETQKVAVTAAEIEARYHAAPKKFAVPAKIRASMIFVEAPASFTAEKRAERRAAIEAARARALADPKEFSALAAEYSYDQSTKFRGGDLGYLVEGTGAEEIEPPVIAAVFALKKTGDLSPIITTKKGDYLLLLTERIDSAIRPLASVAPQIRAELQREKDQEAEQKFKASLAENRRIEARRDRLNSLQLPSRAQPQSHASPPGTPKL